MKHRGSLKIRLVKAQQKDNELKTLWSNTADQPTRAPEEVLAATPSQAICTPGKWETRELVNLAHR